MRFIKSLETAFSEYGNPEKTARISIRNQKN